MQADPVSSWFEAQGISPLLGGAVLGGALVFLLLRAQRSRPVNLEPPRVPQESAPVATGDVKVRALELVRQKNKIGAIKLVREEQGLGLKEAKDVVDAWEREGSGRG